MAVSALLAVAGRIAAPLAAGAPAPVFAAAGAGARERVEELALGLARTRPAAAAVLAVSFLSLVGVPPLAGFVGKLGLFLAALDGGMAWLAVAVVANTVLSLFYYLRVLGPLYFDAAGPPGTDRPALLGRWSAWTMAATGLAVIALGLTAEALLGGMMDAGLLP